MSLVLSFLTSISFLRDGKTADFVYSKLFSGQHGIQRENSGVLILHTVVYFIVGAIFFGFLGIAFDFGEQIISSRISSSQSLSKDAIGITTSILRTSGLLLPLWGTFIGLAIRTSKSEKGLRVDQQHLISPHQFTAIASLGYFAILIVITICIWILLPSLPQLLAYGLIVLISVLMVIGIGVYMIDATMIEEFAENEELSEDNSVVRYYQ